MDLLKTKMAKDHCLCPFLFFNIWETKHVIKTLTMNSPYPFYPSPYPFQLNFNFVQFYPVKFFYLEIH